MQTVSVTNLTSKKWLKRILLVLAGFVVIMIFSGGWFFGYMAYENNQNRAKEEEIRYKFLQEISNLPKIQGNQRDTKINSFMLWEGDSLVELEVKDKGKVTFWYGLDGVPRLERINAVSTSYDCFNSYSDGKKTNYVYTTPLILDKDSVFQKWFAFEVNSLSDLILRYDDILTVLETFPQNPSKVSHTDATGSREVLAQPNNDFVVRPDKNKRSVICDLFT